MTLATQTFKLYTNSGLTVAFTGSESLLHYTNQSDNPQDFQFWYGSTVSGRVLRAVSNPGVDQIVLTPTDTLPIWHIARAYTLGQSVSPITPNGYRYEVTTAGTSHATTEPTWPTTPIGATVVDNGVTWTLRSASHPITEMKLALTSGGLSSATGGAALNLGTSITGGVAGAVQVNMRITNSVITVSNNSGTPEIDFYVNNVREDEV